MLFWLFVSANMEGLGSGPRYVGYQLHHHNEIILFGSTMFQQFYARGPSLAHKATSNIDVYLREHYTDFSTCMVVNQQDINGDFENYRQQVVSLNLNVRGPNYIRST